MLFRGRQPEASIWRRRSEEHTSELQSRQYLVCRLLLEKKKKNKDNITKNKKKEKQNIKSRKKIAELPIITYWFDPINYSNVSTFPTSYIFFFFNDTATTEIYTLSLHDALPI